MFFLSGGKDFLGWDKKRCLWLRVGWYQCFYILHSQASESNYVPALRKRRLNLGHRKTFLNTASFSFIFCQINNEVNKCWKIVIARNFPEFLRDSLVTDSLLRNKSSWIGFTEIFSLSSGKLNHNSWQREGNQNFSNILLAGFPFITFDAIISLLLYCSFEVTI